MKKILIAAVAFALSCTAFAQTPLPGKQEIDKTSVEGLYVTSKMEEKYLERNWEAYLKKYGKPSSSRGAVYKLNSVVISSISPDPISISSKISSSKGVSQVFMYTDLGNGAYVTQGTKGYAEVEAFLRRFATDAQLLDDARIAEEAMKESDKSYQKLVSKAERLKKDIDKTTKELENLKKELEANGKDQVVSQSDLETKKKVYDDAKMKIPKN
jgi:hypothetical protein